MSAGITRGLARRSYPAPRRESVLVPSGDSYHGLRHELRSGRSIAAHRGADCDDERHSECEANNTLSQCAGRCGRSVGGIFCDHCRCRILTDTVGGAL